MVSRRGFLTGMLALGAAPAVVRVESLMKLWVPPQHIVSANRYITMTGSVGGNPIIGVDYGREAGDMTCIVTATEMNGRIIIVDRHWISPHG